MGCASSSDADRTGSAASPGDGTNSARAESYARHRAFSDAVSTNGSDTTSSAAHSRGRRSSGGRRSHHSRGGPDTSPAATATTEEPGAALFELMHPNAVPDERGPSPTFVEEPTGDRLGDFNHVAARSAASPPREYIGGGVRSANASSIRTPNQIGMAPPDDESHAMWAQRSGSTHTPSLSETVRSADNDGVDANLRDIHRPEGERHGKHRRSKHGPRVRGVQGSRVTKASSFPDFDP